jgi:hypothetical protein
MRMLLAIACVACGGPPATPPHDATTEFTFAGAYTLDSTITSALVGSASYSTGQTIHVDRSFSSYAEAQGSSLTVTIVSGPDTGAFAITPDCPYSCGDVLSVSLSATVSWEAGPIVTDDSGYCGGGGSACGFAD